MAKASASVTFKAYKKYIVEIAKKETIYFKENLLNWRFHPPTPYT